MEMFATLWYAGAVVLSLETPNLEVCESLASTMLDDIHITYTERPGDLANMWLDADEFEATCEPEFHPTDPRYREHG